MSVSRYLFLFFISLCILNSCNVEPFEGETQEQIDNNKPTSCEEAVLKTAEASQAFVNTSSTSSNYAELCNTYKTALEDQIESCGDEGGVIQTIIDSLTCGTSTGGGPVVLVEPRAFMTAVINGEAYDDMKPNSYLLFPGGVGVNGFFTRSDDDYISIKGTNGYRNPATVASTDREIDLYIPSVFWKEGTYPMYDIDDNDTFEGVCYYDFIDASTFTGDFQNKINTGEIIITKFSLTERIITGTFSFQYKLVNENDNSEQGPFDVTGTFDYSLDDEFFD